MPTMAYMPYPSVPYGPAAYGHMQMPPNGAMFDFMSTMSGMMDYSAFTVTPTANNYGYQSSTNDNNGTAHH